MGRGNLYKKYRLKTKKIIHIITIFNSVALLTSRKVRNVDKFLTRLVELGFFLRKEKCQTFQYNNQLLQFYGYEAAWELYLKCNKI